MIKTYINVLNGKKIKVDIDLLPLSFVKNLKEIDEVKIPTVVEEVKKGRKPKDKNND